jgi:FAD/FMN-containing dehydrogenase
MSDLSILLEELTNLLGDQYVITEEKECKFYSQDVFMEAENTTKAVIQPGNITELSKAVAAVTNAGYAIFPRGGGMSYTGGYLPSQEKAISLDTSRLNQIVEINHEDMYITVECGCTWAQIHDALKQSDVRTPFWGTLSGLKATVGGGVSQNSLFFGTGLYGSAVESVIGLEVITAKGEMIRTGSASVKGGNVFFRHYGPDLTGIFLGDTGALGIKAKITLKLMKRPKYHEFGSFSFDRYEDMLPAMSEISRKGLASECFGFDPYLQEQRMKRESIAKDIKSLTGVLSAADNFLDAVKKGTKLALAGRGYMKDVLYSFHATSENNSKEVAKSDMDEIRKIAIEAGGKEIENSIPTLINANPFLPLNNMVGPDGERWAPVHGLSPHSRVVKLHDAIRDLFAENIEKIEEYKVGVGYMYVTVGASASLIEPVFFWHDALKELHKDTVDKKYLNSLKGFDENLEIRDFVTGLRKKLILLFKEHAVVHLQIGKSYQYSEGIEENSLNLVKAIKQYTDPDNLINPGSLGL